MAGKRTGIAPVKKVIFCTEERERERETGKRVEMCFKGAVSQERKGLEHLYQYLGPKY